MRILSILSSLALVLAVSATPVAMDKRSSTKSDVANLEASTHNVTIPPYPPHPSMKFSISNFEASTHRFTIPPFDKHGYMSFDLMLPGSYMFPGGWMTRCDYEDLTSGEALPEIGLTHCGRWHVYFQFQQDRPLPGETKGQYRLTLQSRMLEIMDQRLAIGYHMWPASAFPFKTENGVTWQYYDGPTNFDIVVS
ncbi:hypothetical protein DL770_009585 [Monosporascus sp. CRB-9-2]|nr:hypothetical protein DL770_009585 [Monosporascus sp. CRB-9-2]